MIFVFCEVFDAAALWTADRLHGRGYEVAVVTAPALEAATRWEHRISSSGAASVEIELADGRRLSSREPVGVLNRLAFVPTARLDALGGADRDYAVQEMNAFFLSWLHALPGPVLNRPKPQGLGGNWRHPSAWAVLAGRAGLSLVPYRQSCESDPDAAWLPQRPPEAVTVFVVGSHRSVAPPDVPETVREGCLRLAAAAGEALLGIDLVPQNGSDVGWAFLGASPRPDLSLGGEGIVDALAEALRP